MHAFGRLKLVGTAQVDGLGESSMEDLCKPLPFPSCVRDFKTSSRQHDALDALDCVTFKIDQLRKELETDHGPYEGPRAA